MPDQRTIWVVVMTASRARVLRSIEQTPVASPAELVLRSEAHNLRLALQRKDWLPGWNPRRYPARPPAGELLSDDLSFYRLTSAVLDIHRRAGDFHRFALLAPAAVIRAMSDVMPRSLKAVLALECEALAIDAEETELVRAVRRRLVEAGHVP